MTAAAVGMRLQLRGLTKRGKQLEKMCSIWRVASIRDRVIFSDRAGPWLLVEPMMEGTSKILREARWIHGVSDTDFSITKEV